MKFLVASILVMVLCSPVFAENEISSEDPSIQHARQLFELYIQLEHEFDDGIADLYSDDAVITNKRTYPTGKVREMTLPAPKYKELVRQSMPLAKTRGDTSAYDKVEYSIEAGGVRINCDRFSNLKKHHSPMSLLVRADKDGKWLIYEELSESQP